MGSQSRTRKHPMNFGLQIELDLAPPPLQHCSPFCFVLTFGQSLVVNRRDRYLHQVMQGQPRPNLTTTDGVDIPSCIIHPKSRIAHHCHHDHRSHCVAHCCFVEEDGQQMPIASSNRCYRRSGRPLEDRENPRLGRSDRVRCIHCRPVWEGAFHPWAALFGKQECSLSPEKLSGTGSRLGFSFPSILESGNLGQGLQMHVPICSVAMTSPFHACH